MRKLEDAGMHAPAVELGLCLGLSLGLQTGLGIEARLLLCAGDRDGRGIGSDGGDILLLCE